MTEFDVVWQRIVDLQSKTFRQKTGRPFSYVVSGGCVVPGTTNRQLPRSQFARAYERAPLLGPGQLHDLQGPSYLFAILTDPRVGGTGDATTRHEATVPGSAGRAGSLAPKDGQGGSSWFRAVAAPASPAGSAPPSGTALSGRVSRSPGELLGGVEPSRALLVITCSAAKAHGGQPASAADEQPWPEALRVARSRVLVTAAADLSRLMPAWLRYTGTFYRYARPALADAVAGGHVIIISGGYGITRADEPIGWYDKVLRLADWPPGVLESALISEAHGAGAETVVAFASTSTGYAQLLRRTPWRKGGLTARLVTITGVTGGAMAEVPRRLAQAFSAFWNRQQDEYPPGTIVNRLA